MSLTPYRFPRKRSPTEKTGSVGICIYCGANGQDVPLTDEHIVPDGLGGDLVLSAASCKPCAAITSRTELHLLREVLQFARSAAGLSSRKRKKPKATIEVQLEGSPADKPIQMAFNQDTPFIYPFVTTDELPGVFRGAKSDETPKLRISLFGPPDWNQKGQRWLGGNGKFGWKNRLHAGVVGQALAKIAHSYACAAIGPDAFHPLLTDYILAHEPAFDGYHIGIHSSGGFDEALHYIDLQIANVPRQTVIGLMHEAVYVVYLRLFSFQPSPSILVVVGRAKGAPIPSLKVMDLTVVS